MLRFRSTEAPASRRRQIPRSGTGTHGLFYVNGIAFNRAEESENVSAMRSGGEGESGVRFVSVYIDDARI
jgi:hypothetical protein